MVSQSVETLCIQVLTADSVCVCVCAGHMSKDQHREWKFIVMVFGVGLQRHVCVMYQIVRLCGAFLECAAMDHGMGCVSSPASGLCEFAEDCRL